jgi:hypothetical protein
MTRWEGVKGVTFIGSKHMSGHSSMRRWVIVEGSIGGQRRGDSKI